jgi:hypothetical protein
MIFIDFEKEWKKNNLYIVLGVVDESVTVRSDKIGGPANDGR